MSYYSYYPMSYGSYPWFMPSPYYMISPYYGYGYQQGYGYPYSSFGMPGYGGYPQPMSYYPQYYPFSQPYEMATPPYFPTMPTGYNPYRTLPMLPSY